MTRGRSAAHLRIAVACNWRGVRYGEVGADEEDPIDECDEGRGGEASSYGLGFCCVGVVMQCFRASRMTLSVVGVDHTLK